MSDTVTTNYGLTKPDFNARPWDGKVNSNFDLIDSLIYTITQVPNIGGVWKNSTQYTAGQNVLDAQSLTFYQCLVTAVSAASGTFANDRAANPINWTVTSAGLGAIRYDQGQVLLAGQIKQALINLGLFNNSIAVTAGAALATTDVDTDVSVTGTSTITIPTANAGWRTGIISNDNPITELVTLAVPTGATLDGTVNGTTILYPFQRARIRQVAVGAYKTDWVDRAPIIGQQNITSLVAFADFNLPSGYTKFRVEIGNLLFSTAGSILGARVSPAGSGSIKAGAGDYVTQRQISFATTSQAAFVSDTLVYLLSAVNASTNLKPSVNFVLTPGASGQLATFLGQSIIVDTTPQAVLNAFGAYYNGGSSGAIGRANLLRILSNVGTFGGNITVWGEP